MKLGWLFAAGVLLLAAATTPGIAAPDDRPLADAGLDQTVSRGTTVYLDAGASRDPDGRITEYRWSITTPANTTRTPDCADCEQTEFVPDAVGTYEVTLHVTDDEGNTATDTLYVTVNPGEPPSVSLAGPDRLSVGESGKFTATVDAGEAPLDSVVWYVDGERRSRDGISGEAASVRHRTLFPDTGTYEVSVVATDTDGERDRATKMVTVTNETTSQNATETSSGSGVTPDVLGPRVITGTGSLTGSYELSDGSSGTWRLNDRRVGSGKSVTLDFEPGVHELYAVPGGDNGGIAEFPDGTRTVVADPAPELRVEQVDNESVPTIDAHATDGLGNLESLTVFVDGDPVRSVTRSGLEYSDSGGDELSMVERLKSLAPGEHSITVRATDSRGQTDSFETTVDVPGPPEVVSAGFVNEGPLDQYHPRINASRYTATYEVVVDLNGIDASELYWDITFADANTSNIENYTESGRLIIRASGYKNDIGSLIGKSTLNWRGGNYSDESEDTIRVTPAPPELRIEVVAPQTPYKSARRGMKLQARNSFDPDHSTLDFQWRGVQGDFKETPSAHLNSWDAGQLVVTDQQKQQTKSMAPISWFAPKVTEVATQSSGPYYPDESVSVSVFSERYYLSKPTFKSLTSFDLRTSSGRVVNHVVRREQPGEVTDPDPEASAKRQIWTVKIPATAFRNNTPTVASYPTEHPEVEYSHRVPDVVVYTKTGSEIKNISTSVEYRVERPEYSTRQTTKPAIRESLKAAGYEVHRVTDEGRKYELEKYVQVSAARYETKQRTFEKRERRENFLQMNPGWSNGGQSEQTTTKTISATEWRSSRQGGGTFTGRTRQQVVEEAVTRTEKQFRYESTETSQHLVTYQDTVTRRTTHVEYEERCTSFGCQMVGRTVTETQQYTVTRTRTVTRTQTNVETYWSTRSRNPAHEFTGRRRTVTVESAEYETQYQYEFEKKQKSAERTFVAEKRDKVSSAKYEWKYRNTIHNRLHAETAATAEDVRIADVVTTSQWTLKKQTDSTVAIVSEPQSDWKVLETIGTGEGTLVRYYVNGESDRIIPPKKRRTELRVTHEEPGLVSNRKIKNILREKLRKENEG